MAMKGHLQKSYMRNRLVVGTNMKDMTRKLSYRKDDRAMGAI